MSMTKLPKLAASLALSATAVLALASCSTTGDGAARNRGSDQFDTALIKVELNGAERPIVIELYPNDAPRTVANFKQKILDGYFEGMAFHRVIPRYVVQTGDPLTKDDDNRDEWGTGGNESTIPAEIKRKHVKGSVAMARLSDAENPSKASSDSQFYIALRSLPNLDGEYTVFGQVIQGMNVVESMSKAVVDSNDAPLKRVEVVSTALIPADAEVVDEGSAAGVGGRTNTVPKSKKGPFTRFIERVW